MNGKVMSLLTAVIALVTAVIPLWKAINLNFNNMNDRTLLIMMGFLFATIVVLAMVAICYLRTKVRRDEN